jgi:putative transposase
VKEQFQTSEVLKTSEVWLLAKDKAMPRRTTPIIANECYHVYNRGHNRDPIFFERENYGHFLRRLRKYVVPKHAVVIAYALMPNHYHLMVRAVTSELSHAMQLFGISYTKSINKRFDRTGSVFQGAFNAKLIEQDDYLLHLSRYIHLNPVRANLVKLPEAWEFSSYRDYVGLRNGTLPMVDIVLREFARKQTSEVSETSEVWREARTRYAAFVNAYRTSDRRRIAHLLFQ